MIEIQNLYKSYGSLEVLKDISFKIEKGDIFGIIGQSGAGKSTLLRCFNGLENFQKGEVTASYKGLAFSVPQTALPAKSILYQFILAADQLAEESTLQGTSKDGGMVLSGDLEAGSYELTMTAEGVPAIFSMKNQNAVLTFHDFVSNGAVSESETSTESELQTTEPALQTELTELETTLESQE